LDKKKQRAVARNAASALAALREEVGGASDALLAVQTILMRWPTLLELDAGQEWERRFLGLVARTHRGAAGEASSVPVSPVQAAWEEQQRREAAGGVLDESRMALLNGVCFDWGLMDREWEARFDDLLAFTLMAGHADVLGSPRSAPAARGMGELQAWARRQLALHALGTLPPIAVQRLQAVGFLPSSGKQSDAVPAVRMKPAGAPRGKAARRSATGSAPFKLALD